MQRGLLFTGNITTSVKTNLVNKYTSGAGVGAVSTSARRALKRRATSSPGTIDSDGIFTPGTPCCSNPTTSTSSNINVAFVVQS